MRRAANRREPLRRLGAALAIVFSAASCSPKPAPGDASSSTASAKQQEADARPERRAETSDPILVSLSASDPDLLEAVRDYQVLARSAGSSPDAQLCEITRRAQHLNERLGATVGELHAQGALDDSEDLTGEINHLAEVLPGIELVVGAEGVYHFVNFEELGQLAPPQSSARALLTAIAALWDAQNGWPSYLEQLTDVSGCLHPEPARVRLATVFEQWRAAPECLHQSLAPNLTKALEHAGAATCICESEPEAQPELVALLRTLHDSPLADRSAATELGAALEQSTLKYECAAGD